MQADGVGVVRTWQRVDLPSNPQGLVFSVNGHEFRLEGGKVEAAGQVWTLKPGEVVEIRADDLGED
jgi:hypothetical protein